MFVFLNGKFVKEEQAVVSIFDHGFLYGDGVYETLRTHNGKVWHLKEHLSRLKKSCKIIGIKLPWTEQKIGEWVQQTVNKNGFGAGVNARIRVTVTRGKNDFDFATCKKPSLLIQVKKLVAPPLSVSKKGVAVVTFRAQRFLPEVKSISLLPMAMGMRYAKKMGAYEAVFVNDADYVLEGTITNIFIVKDGVLFTPKTGVLAGTTRDFLVGIARKNGLKVAISDFKLNDLYKADEVFITNAPRGIIPVVKVDGTKIGSGKPGIITKKLFNLYEKFV